MPSNPEHFYISAEDYETQTSVPHIFNSLTDDEVTALLLQTMVEIDAYVGSGWVPFDEGQEFIFPRSQDEDADGDAEIPRAVQTATRMVADAILVQRKRGVSPHEVNSEAKAGHSYSKKTADIMELGFEHWPPIVCQILSKYRRFPSELAIRDPDEEI